MEEICEEGTVSRFLGTWPRRHLIWTWKAANGSSIRMTAASGTTPNRTECSVEAANIVIAIIALIPPALLVMWYKCGERQKTSGSLLPLHNVRSLLCLGLLLFFLLDLSESLFEMRLLLPILSILLVLVCWTAHRAIEVWNGIGVIVTAASFAMVAVARVWRLIYIHGLGLTFAQARVTATTGAAVCCSLLTIVDTYAVYRLVQKDRKYTVHRQQSSNISYKHREAPFLSRITFHWVVELLGRGYQAPLDLQDIGELPSEESTRVQFEKFWKIYKKEVQRTTRGGKFSLWRCFWKRIWRGFLIGGILKLFGDVMTLAGPMAISRIISYVDTVQNGTITDRGVRIKSFVTLDELMQNGYFLGLLVFLAAVLQSTFSQASTHILNVEGIHLRTALQALVYDKALRMCSWNIAEEEKVPDTREKEGGDGKTHQTAPDIGTLTNLMAEDAYNVMGFFWIGHYTWAVPVKISAIIFLVYLKLGISAIIGAICCILIVTPMQLYLGKRMSANSEVMAERSDARLRLMNEVLQGIRLIKLRAWEDLFKDRIGQSRNKELKLLDRDSFYWALITFLTHASSVLMTLVTFGVYFWVEERKPDAGNVFASLALFSQLTVPLCIFPVIIPIIIHAKISTTRLEDFLQLPETVNILPENDSKSADGRVKRPKISDAEVGKIHNELSFGDLDNIEEGEEDHNSSESVFFKEPETSGTILSVDGVFSWGSEENQLVIENLKFPQGKLTLIVGRIGTGKTSLLLASLGEIPTVRGSVEWSKDIKIAYVSQKPWLQNATLRENILFGSDFRPSRYRSVLRACALQDDIAILPAGDLTRIGEKGINLSGGQKQRISIARAIYSDADTIILDDPLSALDQQVGHQVFDHGIQRLLLGRGRTVIMVTHMLELISAADHIVAMEGCRVRSVGSRAAIEVSDPELAAEWREAARRKDSQSKAQKTAKDRWSLVRLVSRIGINLQRSINAEDGSWSTDQDANVTPSAFVPLRTRRSTLHGSRYLAHDLTDLPVPTEEWSVVRKRSKKHKNAARATSLQPPKHPPPVLRQSSTPTILESQMTHSRRRYNTLDSGQQNGTLKQIFSGRTTPSQEWEHQPMKRLLSSESGYTDETDEDYDGTSNPKNAGGEDTEYDQDLSGLVTVSVCGDYLRAGGIGPNLIYISVALLCQAVRVYTDIWLSDWTHQGSHHDATSDLHEETIFYFRVYIALSVSSILLAVVYSAAGQWAGARARRRLHQEAVTGILEAPLVFFERTPIGRILNSFSADMGVIDKKLSTVVQRTTGFVLLCGSAMLVNVIISPWFLAAAVPICFAYFLVQRFYRRSARELQRLDGSTRGPAAAHFSETLAGLATLRASKQEDRFMDEMVEHLDSNTNAFLILNTSSRWLGIALDYLGAVIVGASIFAAIMSAELYPSRVTPALVGLAVNYTLLVPIYLNWVVKFVSDIEMYMGSVARLSAYTKTPREEYRDDGQAVPGTWPESGEVLFENVSLRYGTEGEPIVTNLQLLIPARQKLGICGRTGSGKSSAAMSLFQFVQVYEGRILVDGVDIHRIPLRLLRSRISAIPQDVILFSGTVRENLDPLGHHSDDELWAALELAQIKDIVKTCPEGLNTEVREGGENFSAGQRQLLSMARATLRRSSIVVLDEATSALDAVTEKSVLTGMATSFRDRTVITIAHRVASLLDCDRVVVFDGGRVVEDGPPKDLLRRPTGVFSAMLKSSEESIDKA
ncbi:ATP-binding cassette sub-family C member Sur isoform X1 [Neodiprion pinetum]|uniref:ATP-binding cassette sub-family C member Sur isoform X1 n=2 Tax=Neodiprion pinetum TaxID=441929 RepID=UPI001EDD0B93|nr:ATP-binding cassette sub-family C member Sur-like [Neodiprion pinetum]